MVSSDALELGQVARRLIDEVCERLTADAVALWLRGEDGSELRLAGAVGLHHRETLVQLAHRPSARVADWLVPRRVPAALTLKRNYAAGERAWLAAEDVHSLLAVPVTVGETSFGVLAAFRRRRPFPVGSLSRAAGLAAAAAPLLHATSRLEAQRTRAERAETVLDVANILAGSTNLELALEAVARRTAQAVGAARWHVSLSTSAPTDARDAASALVLPISGKDGAIATLTLIGPPGRAWSPAAVELAAAVAAQVGRAAEQHDVVQRRAVRALAELASGAAHHLNNLLTVVVGRVQLVLRSTGDERVQRTLTVAEKAARDAADVVQQLQQFARVRGVRQPRPVRVDQLVTEVVSASQRRALRTPLTKVDVETRLADVPPIAGDAAALREALGRIVDNAMEAMPAGGRLLIETRASQTAVTIAVTDTGVGMSAAVRVRAMQPFFTTKGVKATGLGLSVAYGIVRSHGGDLAIRSAEAAGTTVTMTLPCGSGSGAQES